MIDPKRLRTYLEGARDFGGKIPTEYHYRNVYDFVLREGRFFKPQPRPDSITLRHIGECFRNAFLTMMRTGLQYAEGYAVVGSKIPVLHAWNVDAEGSVIDSTWEPVGSIYFGIVFPASIVEHAQTSVLDDFRKRLARASRILDGNSGGEIDHGTGRGSCRSASAKFEVSVDNTRDDE